MPLLSSHPLDAEVLADGSVPLMTCAEPPIGVNRITYELAGTLRPADVDSGEAVGLIPISMGTVDDERLPPGPPDNANGGEAVEDAELLSAQYPARLLPGPRTTT